MLSGPLEPGDYNQLPALDLSGMSNEQLLAAMPQLTEEQEKAVRMALANIVLGSQQNVEARRQLALMLSSLTHVARSIGMVMTLA